MITREETAQLIEKLDDSIEVETDQDGYTTKIRFWVEEGPVELYPARKDRIGVIVTD